MYRSLMLNTLSRAGVVTRATTRPSDAHGDVHRVMVGDTVLLPDHANRLAGHEPRRAEHAIERGFEVGRRIASRVDPNQDRVGDHERAGS
jgi:hypothetical protein